MEEGSKFRVLLRTCVVASYRLAGWLALAGWLQAGWPRQDTAAGPPGEGASVSARTSGQPVIALARASA